MMPAGKAHRDAAMCCRIPSFSGAHSKRLASAITCSGPNEENPSRGLTSSAATGLVAATPMMTIAAKAAIAAMRMPLGNGAAL